MGCLTNQPFPKQAMVFTYLPNTSFENTMGKGTSNFSLFQCFPPFWSAVSHVHQIKNCHLQTLSVWKSIISVVWGKGYGIWTLKIGFQIPLRQVHQSLSPSRWLLILIYLVRAFWVQNRTTFQRNNRYFEIQT